MDIKTIRKLNVRLLEREIGSLSALARKVGTSQSYLSQCVGNSGIRSIGDEMARRMEHSMGKPHGWLDQPHMDEGHVMAARQVYDKLLHVTPAKLHAVAELLDVKLEAGFQGQDVQPHHQQHESKGRVITLEDDGNQKKRR